MKGSHFNNIPSTQDLLEEGAFTNGVEGPAVNAEGELFAVNFQHQGSIGKISFHPTTQASIYAELEKPSIGNGIRFNKNGDMLVADYVGHNILIKAAGQQNFDVFAHNASMNQPNDIAINARGQLFASDPNWAQSTGQLWRIDTDGSTTLLEANMGTTNGVEVSTDEKHLYVNESVQKRIWIYDLSANGDISNKRLFFQFDDFGLDGMRCDIQGNLYVARYGKGVVAVLSPAGELLSEIPLKGEKPTNVAFGGKDGKTLFITMQARGTIEYTHVPFPGRAFAIAATKR